MASLALAFFVVAATAQVPLRAIGGDLVWIDSDEGAHLRPLAGAATLFLAAVGIAVRRRGRGWSVVFSSVVMVGAAAYLLWVYQLARSSD